MECGYVNVLDKNCSNCDDKIVIQEFINKIPNTMKNAFFKGCIKNTVWNVDTTNTRFLKDIVIENVIFEDCDMSNVVFDFCKMSNVTFKNVDLTNSSFHHMNMTSVYLEENLILSNTLFHKTTIGTHTITKILSV